MQLDVETCDDITDNTTKIKIIGETVNALKNSQNWLKSNSNNFDQNIMPYIHKCINKFITSWLSLSARAGFGSVSVCLSVCLSWPELNSVTSWPLLYMKLQITYIHRDYWLWSTLLTESLFILFIWRMYLTGDSRTEPLYQRRRVPCRHTLWLGRVSVYSLLVFLI